MKSVVCISLFLFLSACVKVSDAPDGTQNPPSPIRPVATYSLGDQEGIFLQELDSPNAYQVKLDCTSDEFLITRTEDGIENSEREIPIPQNSNSVVDAQVIPGKTYIYKIHSHRAGGDSVLSKPIRIPVDYEISGTLSLQKDETWANYRRIFIDANAIIATNEFNLTIFADQIISRSGRIRNFLEGVTAPAGQNGKSGGTVKIKTRTGQGTLKIELQGQTGAPGAHGLDRRDSIDGGNGGDGSRGGDSGSGEISIQENYQLNLTLILQGGAGGEPGPGGRGTNEESPNSYNVGLPGQRGAVGNVGQVCVNDLKGQKCYGEGTSTVAP